MDANAQLKELTRTQMRLVWEIAQQNGPLSDEEARLAQAMREHPEYPELWPRLDTLTDEEIESGGVNPLLHVQVHAIIDAQVAEGNPVEAGAAIEALTRRGLSRHEAVHSVANEFMGELFYVLRDDRPFDMQSYVRKLARLTRGRAESNPKRRGQKRKR